MRILFASVEKKLLLHSMGQGFAHEFREMVVEDLIGYRIPFGELRRDRD